MRNVNGLGHVAATIVGAVVFLATVHAQNPPQGPPGMPFDLDAMFAERQILAQFDASRNGRLELPERRAAREWLAKQPPTGLAAVIGTIWRTRGSGGPGGPPGMPPLGGRGWRPGHRGSV